MWLWRLLSRCNQAQGSGGCIYSVGWLQVWRGCSSVSVTLLDDDGLQGVLPGVKVYRAKSSS